MRVRATLASGTVSVGVMIHRVETCGDRLSALIGVLLVACSLAATVPAAAQQPGGAGGSATHEPAGAAPVLARAAFPDAAVPDEPRLGHLPQPLAGSADTAEDRHGGAAKARRAARAANRWGVRAVRSGAPVYDAAPRYALLCSYRL